MNITKNFETILNMVFFFLGDKVKGYRTIILNITGLIVGLWSWVVSDGGLFSYLCGLGDTVSWMAQFCNPETFKIYPVIITVIAMLNLIARRVTDAPVGMDRTKSAQLRVGGFEVPGILDAILIMALLFTVIILVATGGISGLIIGFFLVAIPSVLFALGVIAL